MPLYGELYSQESEDFQSEKSQMLKRVRLSCGLFEHVCEKAQRFYEIASFFRYAVADGIHRLLFGSPTGPRREARAQPESGRQLMPFAFLDGCGAWGSSRWERHLR